MVVGPADRLTCSAARGEHQQLAPAVLTTLVNRRQEVIRVWWACASAWVLELEGRLCLAAVRRRTPGRLAAARKWALAFAQKNPGLLAEARTTKRTYGSRPSLR
jgi:hypothetical protein